MLHILKPLLLWLTLFGINRLVNAGGQTWDFKYSRPQVSVTLGGSKPDCGGLERRYVEAGELMGLTVHCNKKEAYKYTWGDGPKPNIQDLPFVFQIVADDEIVFPVGKSCNVVVSPFSLFFQCSTLPLLCNPRALCAFSFHCGSVHWVVID